MDINTILQDNDVPIGSTKRMDCQFCGGKNTFTITNSMGSILFNCYKASCSVSGSIRVPMTVEQISDDEFNQKVLEGSKDKPVLVDFWAEWCGPCKAIAPILDNLASEMGDKISIKKINIDENPQAPANFSIRSIPTMILFKDGSMADAKIGLGSEADLRSWINSKL